MAKATAVAPSPLPLVDGRPPVPPTALSCLRCQVLGHRKLMCSGAEACRSVPYFFALGPLLLIGWAATAAAFFFAVR